MAADKICCVSGCTKSHEDGFILYKFPNPTKDPTHFCTWVQAFGGNFLCLDDICMCLSTEEFVIHILNPSTWTRSIMLSNIAIPILHMKGAVAKRPPLAEVTNKNNTLKTSYTQEIASTSSYVQETTTAQTFSLTVTKPKRAQISTRLNVLKKKLKRLNKANEI